MTEEQKAEIKRLYEAKIRVKSIGVLVGLDLSSVKRYIYKTLKLRNRNMRHTISTLSKIKALRIEGKKGFEIENILGISKNQIKYLFRQTGEGYKKIDKSNEKKSLV